MDNEKRTKGMSYDDALNRADNGFTIRRVGESWTSELKLMGSETLIRIRWHGKDIWDDWNEPARSNHRNSDGWFIYHNEVDEQKMAFPEFQPDPEWEKIDTFELLKGVTIANLGRLFDRVEAIEGKFPIFLDEGTEEDKMSFFAEQDERAKRSQLIADLIDAVDDLPQDMIQSLHEWRVTINKKTYRKVIDALLAVKNGKPNYIRFKNGSTVALSEKGQQDLKDMAQDKHMQAVVDVISGFNHLWDYFYNSDTPTDASMRGHLFNLRHLIERLENEPVRDEEPDKAQLVADLVKAAEKLIDIGDYNHTVCEPKGIDRHNIPGHIYKDFSRALSALKGES